MTHIPGSVFDVFITGNVVIKVLVIVYGLASVTRCHSGDLFWFALDNFRKFAGAMSIRKIYVLV